MLKTLAFIAEELNEHKITWGVGGSLLLNFYKLIDKPNDIDILVDEADAARLNKIMLSIGSACEATSIRPFCTTYFSEYEMNKVEIDVMGGLAIQHDVGIYKLAHKQESIVASKLVNGIEIPLCSLEDWYILYWLIPNKQEKAILIEEYLMRNGVEHPRIIEDALKQPLPIEVRKRVEKLYN
ncbi:nucleotidyltransferase family protein [Oceanobacillus sp. CAU 1775]